MNSNEEYTRGSIGDDGGGFIDDEFSSDDSPGAIIPPPPPPPLAWESTTNYDAPPPPPLGDIRPAAVPDCPSILTTTTTQPPTSIDYHSDDVALASDEAAGGEANSSFAPPPYDDVRPSPRSPPLRLWGGMNVMEQDRAPDRTTPPSPPISSFLSIPPMDEECDEAPPPPEIVAASFEALATMPESTDDDFGVTATDPEGQIALPFEGHVHEEITQWEAEDDLAPPPPEMVAASFEGYGYEEEKREEDEECDEAPPPPELLAASFEAQTTKPEFIDDNTRVTATDPDRQIVAPAFEGNVHEGETPMEAEDDLAPPPPEMVAASFEGHGYEEEKREEGEEDEAPGPPEMIAASYEAIDNADQEAKKKSPYIFESVNNPQVLEDRVASVHETEVNINSAQDIIGRLHEVFDNDGNPATMENREGLMDPLSSSDQHHPTASNVQVGAFSISPTPQGGDRPILAGCDQGHVEVPTLTTEELMSPSRPNFDPNNQSLPLLEATLVQDVPEEPVYIYINANSQEPVYDAFPVRNTRRWKVVMLGLVLVASAAIIAVLVVVSGSSKEPSSPSMTGSETNSTEPSSPSMTASGTNSTATVMITSGPTAAPLIWKQQGPAIVGVKEAVYGSALGTSVALSKNASTVVMGAPDYNAFKGYVVVYRTGEDGGNRTQLGQTIYGNATDDYFGWSVDITADGTTIICGSPGKFFNCDDRPGYVRIFSLQISDDDLDAATWNQIGQDIIGEGIGYEFGSSVSIADDGKTIAVGAPNNDEYSGLVRIYRLVDDGSSWEKIGNDIDGDASSESGSSVSLSANGTTVAIGAPFAEIDGIRAGQVKVYRIDSEGASWEPLGQIIHGDNDLDCFGLSVKMSPDGNTLAIGSPAFLAEEVRQGYARVVSLVVGDDIDKVAWKPIGKDINSKLNGERFGWSVSLSDDGKTLAVGAPGENNVNNGDDVGHLRVYRTDADPESGWTKLGVDIDGQVANDLSGYSVSLSADGNTVAVGSPLNNDNGDYSGHVRVFVLDDE